MIKNKFGYYLALAFIKKLWADGIISEEEMNRIDARNKASFNL